MISAPYHRKPLAAIFLFAECKCLMFHFPQKLYAFQIFPQQSNRSLNHTDLPRLHLSLFEKDSLPSILLLSLLLLTIAPLILLHSQVPLYMLLPEAAAYVIHQRSRIHPWPHPAYRVCHLPPNLHNISILLSFHCQSTKPALLILPTLPILPILPTLSVPQLPESKTFFLQKWLDW